jgi:UDP-N-acetylglucosamine/UDP-N-acetylgalactosamine 4-epimerase
MLSKVSETATAAGIPSMTKYSRTLDLLRAQPRTWLITGVAGFIGSHLLEALLKLGQRVVGIDDFSTGSRKNLDEVQSLTGTDLWNNFHLLKGSVCDLELCRKAVHGADLVLHEAGFVSVPQSIEDPVACNRTNVDGFVNMLTAAREAGVQRFVYASSSAVYGDDATMPKAEEKTGAPLSPYGASKWIDEIYAGVFFKNHGFGAIGLRYFNIFGPRQNPAGGYAAVIPKWITSLAKNEPCVINGDGGITRDFCHIDNVVQANILAALSSGEAGGQVFNVAYGARSTLLELHSLIAQKLTAWNLPVPPESPVYHAFRAGDILHSGADISKIRRELGYEPSVDLDAGLENTIGWYLANPA